MKICKKNELITYIAFSGASLASLILHFILTACGIETGVNPWFYFVVFALIWLPLPLYAIFKMEAPLWVTLVYEVFIVLSYTFASVWKGYDLIPNYDLFVHFLSGVIISIFAYTFYMQKNADKKLSAFWVFLLIFAIAVACGAIWEIWEYVLDAITHGNAQRHTLLNGTPLAGHDALTNTIGDLIADTLGALVASIVCAVLYRKSIKKPAGTDKQKDQNPQ